MRGMLEGTRMISVPIWLIIAAVAVGMILLLATILMFFAWKGMDLMNRELQERLRIVQIDVSGWLEDPRPLHQRDARFRLDHERLRP